MATTKCDGCGAPRVYKEAPASLVRDLCECEEGERVCYADECTNMATSVQFMALLRGGKEPKKRRFTCAEHGPKVAPPVAAPTPPATPPAPSKSVRRRKAVQGETEKPSVDPIYKLLGSPPPKTASSTARVQCWSCKDVHELRARKNHNGTHSECPKCGDDMHTYDPEETAA